ncbi:MAG: hypothetical protein V1917_01410 [Candidatus Gottesmanbacteria bacterium]
MLTNNDIKKLSAVFATKDDLNSKVAKLESNLDSKIDHILDIKLKPIHKKLNVMQKSLNTSIKYFDTITTNYEQRLKNVEKKIEILPLVAAAN